MNNLAEMDDSMDLEVPASPEFVSTARLFAAEASRHLGVTEESVADLKIAISEACTGAIQAQTPVDQVQPVRLKIQPQDDSVEVEVFAASGFNSPAGVPEPVDGLGLGLVRALFPQAEYRQGQDRSSTLRIQVPLGPA